MRPGALVYTIPLPVSLTLPPEQVERELEEELQLHLAQRSNKKWRGKTPEEARIRALLAMEGMEQRKEECRDARRSTGWEDLVQTHVLASRILIKTPGFTIVAAICWPSASARKRGFHHHQ